MPARPTHCPYCGTEVTEMRPHVIETPPDERANPQRNPSSGSGEQRHRDAASETTECVHLSPCGHLFKREDVEAAGEGELLMTALGDRVQNPNSPVN